MCIRKTETEDEPMNVVKVRRGDIFYADLPCLTSQIKNADMECHFVLPMLKGLPLQTMVLGEQRFTIDKSQLAEYRCHLGRRLMRKVTRAIRAAEREDYEDKPKRKWNRKKK